MSWDAVERTVNARVQALTVGLPPILAALGLPPLATDALGESGLAVYPGPVLSYASPCVELVGMEGTITREGGVITELEGWVVLSYKSTDGPVAMKAMAIGYLTALVRAFSTTRDGPDEYWEVTEVTTTPAANQGETFMQAVAVKVVHQIAGT